MPFRETAPVCQFCPKLAIGECDRCSKALCEHHQHGRRTRCPECEQGFDEQVAALEASFPVVRGATWKSLPRDAVALTLFAVTAPVVLLADVAALLVSLEFSSEFWPMLVTRRWWDVLRGKERAMWARRKRELRVAFLAEQAPAKLPSGPLANAGPGR